MIRVLNLSMFVAALLACGTPSAQGAAGGPGGPARGYPTKPIRFVVPFAPGAGTDIVARIIGGRLAERWGQPVVIDNRPGAGGTVGAAIAARSPPDGYTLVMGSVASIGTAKGLRRNLPYDPVKDFAPVTQAVRSPSILLVHPSVPAKSVKELIALAKSKPGALNYASSGPGSPGHLNMELFKTLAGVDMVHVPYKELGTMVTDLIGGRTQVTMGSLIALLPHVKAGKLRALAVTGSTRSPVLPDLAAVMEAGLPGYEAYGWFGVLAPARTPKEIVAKLNAEMVRILRTPEVRDQLTSQGSEVVANTPDEFAAFIRKEVAKWTKVIRDSGATMD